MLELGYCAVWRFHTTVFNGIIIVELRVSKIKTPMQKSDTARTKMSVCANDKIYFVLCNL